MLFRFLIVSGTVAVSVAATLTLALSSTAFAYDEDTHFYGTYAMARYAGIKHEVAARIALSAQWMDESYISDPTSMIVLPITGIKKRRLLHFPSSRVVGSLSASTQQSFVNHDSNLVKYIANQLIKFFNYEGKLDGLNFLTETTEDNPFASELLMQGLKEGNLMMSAASIHVLEDSFAHAGTPAEQGHAAFWHWPDRPYASLDKYYRMVPVVFSALTAIRAQLPPDAIDCKLHLASIPTHQPNCEMDATQLAANYSSTAAVTTAVSANVLHDPEYVKFAMRDFLTRAAQAGYLKVKESKVDDIITKLPIDGKIDSYDAAEIVIRALIKKQMREQADVIDIRFILTDMGRIGKDAKDGEVVDYIDSYGIDSNALSNPNSDGIRNLVHAIAHELLKWKVPSPLNDSHRMELEDDASPIRGKEMQIRNDHMRNMIRTLFSTDIKLVNNNTKDDVGFYREIILDKSAEPVLPKSTGTYFATFSLREKNLWDHMIFQYLFPSLNGADLLKIIDQAAKVKNLGSTFSEYLDKRKEINKANQGSFFVRKAKLWKLDLSYGPVTSRQLAQTVTSTFSGLRPIAPVFLSDLANSHLTPSPDNYYYRNPRLFSNYREAGTVKPLLTSSDVWSLDLLTLESSQQADHKQD